MPKKSSNLLQFTERGIWCQQADVFIDPWRPVDKALITHGHADHSRLGHKFYLSTTAAAPVIKYRLGKINLNTIDYGKSISVNGVNFSFHPAGHIVGSAQIRVAYKDEVWVASGDYKLENDGLAEAYEPIRCNTFITETTFGLPVYNWKPQQEVFNDINTWWKKNAEEGKITLITGYSLGKAQRILQGLDTSIGKIFTHGAVENINEVIRDQGIELQGTTRIITDTKAKECIGGIIIAPPSSINSPWLKRFKPLTVGIASGWMTLRGARRRRGAERGFVLSDHVDWKDLNIAVLESGAERVITTHGYASIYARYLEEKGIESFNADTEYTGEQLEIGAEKKEEGQSETTNSNQ
ncbi:MAG: putative mRNA 3-end processing factor [Saprospiraceae bacterium]|jgi:putative mRNA 3-end processing factor